MIGAFAPGRVNLVGDHTDYSGGLVCPMAIDLGTTVEATRGGSIVELWSDVETAPARVPLDVPEPASVHPAWARYVAGVVRSVGPTAGATGRITTTLPVGAGLSSSAALELCVALALGADPDDPVALAQICQRAEHLASGVPCGIMDQLVCATGVAGHALMIDCTTLVRTPVPIPMDLEVVVVHSGQTRSLATSDYAARRASVEEASRLLGAPLRQVTDVEDLGDPLLRRRARHVVTENRRVLEFTDALRAVDLAAAGAAMVASHASLRDDFEVSTPRLDGLVADLCARPGVWGARMTGAGFGGCVVALARPGAITGLPRMWTVTPSPGARLLTS